MVHVDDDEDELEPPWPGWRAMVSGRAGGIALMLLIAVGFIAYRLVSQQQEYNSPGHTLVVCAPLGEPTGDSGAPQAEPTQICVTGHN